MSYLKEKIYIAEMVVVWLIILILDCSINAKILFGQTVFNFGPLCDCLLTPMGFIFTSASIAPLSN